MATMTSGVHAMKLDNETMTAAIHRTKDADETMTEQMHDLEATVTNSALPSGTFNAATDSAQTATTGTITWVAPAGGDAVTTYSVSVEDTAVDIAGSPFILNGDVLTLDFTGLAVDTAFDTQVTALNGAGSVANTAGTLTTLALRTLVSANTTSSTEIDVVLSAAPLSDNADEWTVISDSTDNVVVSVVSVGSTVTITVTDAILTGETVTFSHTAGSDVAVLTTETVTNNE